MGVSPEAVPDVTEESIAAAFNQLLEDPDFLAQVRGDTAASDVESDQGVPAMRVELSPERRGEVNRALILTSYPMTTLGAHFGARAWISFFFLVVIWIVSTIVSIGMIKFILAMVDGRRPEYKELFVHYRYFIKYAVGSILYALIVLAGAILLVVPGIIWAIKYQYYYVLIVDQNRGPVTAIKESGRITMGYKWELFLFGLLLILINLLGLVCLVIGLLATIPLSLLAYMYVYRALLKRQGESSSVPTPEGVPA
jgi:uncharacterized membrane protein